MEFLQPSFWFTLQPPIVTEGIGRAFLILFLATFILGIVLRLRARRTKKDDRFAWQINSRAASLLITMGFIGLILSFFGYERIRFLGARFWYPVWILITAVWAYYLWRFAKKTVPKMKESQKEKREREKYLPGKN